MNADDTKFAFKYFHGKRILFIFTTIQAVESFFVHWIFNQLSGTQIQVISFLLIVIHD